MSSATNEEEITCWVTGEKVKFEDLGTTLALMMVQECINRTIRKIDQIVRSW